MERKITLSARQIAGLLGISKQAVHQRANKERWPFIENPVRGGYERLFYFDELPCEIKNLILMEGEMKKTMEERIEPVADGIVGWTEKIFGSKAFDRVCIGAGLIALGWLLAWMQFIGQRG